MDVTNEFNMARSKIFNSIKAELLGPGSEDVGPNIENEVITDSPLKRYSIGILYPQESIQHKEDNEDFSCDEKDGIDDHIDMANQLLPASMGVTFFVKSNVTSLNINVSCSKYRTTTFEDCCVNASDIDMTIINDPMFSEYIYCKDKKLYLKRNLHWEDINKLKETGLMNQYSPIYHAVYKLFNQCSDEKAKRFGYIRVPLNFNNPIEIDFASGKYVEKIIDEEEGLKLVALRRDYKGDISSFTVVLVNVNIGKSVRNTFFQPKIEIKSEDNPTLTFVKYMENPYLDKQDSEEESLELLYRNKNTYAIGHGVSVEYDTSQSGCSFIKSAYMPTFEVPKLNFNIKEIEDISCDVLSMKNLSDISKYDKVKKITLLRRFITAYSKWITDLKTELYKLNKKYHNAGIKHIKNCEIACQRMIRGIELIQNDKLVYEAFSLANRAMLMQRVHSKIQEQNKGRFPDSGVLQEVDYKSIKDKDASWRPFQLSFILMCIESMNNPNSDDRDYVDLIWVPTGGGKTEAYLGLTAYTIFLRRLKEPISGGGTTIIMRYTLRLLAAQQFIRASTLICACEKIRREGSYNLGKEEITIGLWIGSNSTPNTIKEAKDCYKNLSRSTVNNVEYNKNRYNKFQLLKCPWCGTKLIKEIDGRKLQGLWGYGIKRGEFILRCTEQDCEFEEHLPIKVVDEDIYKHPPTLLFGTVDKFAMITWKEEVSKLFALDNENRNRSPELVIQDELHLISGPLGTIVGLYETAIDVMCSYKGVRPKIIASTATIRRAKEQCKQLYTRDVKQFPPPGLSAEDSFFTREIPVDKEPGRLYVGVMPSGKTQTTVEIRLMATLLQKIKTLDLPEEIKDQYWTLVGYFNSIRELGKCSTLVDDDIKDAMRRLSNRMGSKLRTIFQSEELTGRIPSGQITKTLEKLEVKYSKELIDKKQYAANVLLATNMISVGVDVSRLNLMVVVGQPKLTSEYIQASSRVGRNKPGIVFTLYNGARSRDRSYYEKFSSYHQSFYKYVEPTSITPFAEPARDRALHALLISLMRHIGGLNAEEMASSFDINNESIKEIEGYVLDRIKRIDKALVNETKNQINEIWNTWDNRIKSLCDGELLTYTKEDKKHLLKPFGKMDGNVSFETLQAMRNVDVESAIHILVNGDDENE